jgi:hypothetical protein
MARVLPTEGVWAGRLAWLALALSGRGVALALIGAIRQRAGRWHFRPRFTLLRYDLFMALAGGVLAGRGFLADA